MIFTAFRGSYVKDKVIYPYREDHAFDFYNVDIDDSDFIDLILQVGVLIANEFILNYPLQRSVRTLRDQAHLQNHLVNKLDYVFLDFDNIYNEQTAHNIVEVMKNNDYKFVIYKSRSFGKIKENGEKVFNLKGLLFVDIEFNSDIIGYVLETIDATLREEIFDEFNLDVSMKNFAGYQAPLNREADIIGWNEGSNIPRFFQNKFNQNRLSSNRIQNSQPVHQVVYNEQSSNNQFREYIQENISYEIIEELRYDLGFRPIRINENGTIQFSRVGEISSGGYYSFIDDQLVIRHPLKEKNVYLLKYLRNIPEVEDLIRRFNGID